jgi:ATP-dependent Clp protease ATP-binding subunit ClpA
MSDAPMDKGAFFRQLSDYLSESMKRRGKQSHDVDDIYYGLANMKGGATLGQHRSMDQKGLIADMKYVVDVGRPTGYERPDVPSQMKEALKDLLPGISADFNSRMDKIMRQIDAEDMGWSGQLLAHEEKQFMLEAYENYTNATPPTINSMAEFLIKRIIVQHQYMERKEQRRHGQHELPIAFDGETNSLIARVFEGATEDPFTTLAALEGDADSVSMVRVRRFAQAIDPKFNRLLTSRNNTQLSNSSAVPESDMPATDLVKIVSQARDEASLIGDTTMEPKHLFLALLDNDQVKSELNRLNQSARRVNVAEIRMALMANDVSKADDTQPEPSPAFHRALDSIKPEFEGNNTKYSASRAVQKLLKAYPELNDALLQAGFTESRIERWASIAGKEIRGGNDEPFKVSDQDLKKALDSFTRDITKMAADGKLDPIIGRESETEQLKVIMTHRKKKNPIVIGEPGVGKTALMHAYALEVAAGNVPDNQKGARVLELDMQAMLAGTRYRGDFEERIKTVVQGVSERNARGDRPPIILGIDEAHTIVGMGATSGGSNDAANMLKTYLQEGNLWTMMFTTEDEYTKYIEKDGALTRRTQTLKVNEPSPSDTVAILKGLKSKYEEHYDVKYTDEALETIVALGGRYIHNRHFPDKGIDILDGAGAMAFRDGKGEVDREAITEVISRMAKLPKEYLSQEDNSRYANLSDNLKQDVFGQDQAVDEVAYSLAVAKAGLREPNKPIGSYLFVGPTGVGKTELAKSLAKHTSGDEENIIRIDMSEYMEKHSVSKLLGTTAGYVGYDNEGKLSGAVRRNPNAVVVFDEIEKAHPDVQNILLQIMDNGKISDGQGRVIDFSNTMLVMTSNLGAAAANAEADRTPIGFLGKESKSEVDRSAIMMKAVEGFFTPEFRNRLDGVIPFNELGRDVMQPILSNQLKKLGKQMKQTWGIDLEVSDSAKETLMEEGFDARMGARPLKRAIERLVTRPLSMWLLKNKDMRERPGSTVTVESVGKEFKMREDGGNDMVVNPKRIVEPPEDLPGDTLARLMDRRRAAAPSKDARPAPAPGRRFG